MNKLTLLTAIFFTLVAGQAADADTLYDFSFLPVFEPLNASAVRIGIARPRSVRISFKEIEARTL
jgi:hypothetical protein